MKSWKLSTAIVGATLTAFALGFVAKSVVADQPEMQTALQHLEAAKTALESAGHEHGGHRKKALAATEHAIKEVEDGIAWAEKHPKETEPGPKGPQPKG